MNDNLLEYIDKTMDKSIEELKKICRIPSVAAKGEHMEEAAEFLIHALDGIGLETSLHKTSGFPVVTGTLDVGAKRTLMFYDHYDVQPRIWALKAFKETGTDIPVNIKFVIEGEEEISSPNLHEFVSANKDFMKADGGIWEFGGEDLAGKQEAWLGLKGLLYVQLEIQRLSVDAHSAYACILPSAPYRLIWALNSLKSMDGKILIDGFYDEAQELSSAELNAISKIDVHESQVKDHYAIEQFLNGLEGDNLKEAYYNAPTCNICGIDTGWQGSGSKTVLPAKAMAKIDFRLVETMEPADILKKLRVHLDKHGFTDIKIAWHSGYAAAKTPVDDPFVQVVNRANKAVFGHDLVIHPTSPGSGPLYLFKEYVPMVSIGCGDFYSGAHSPNESIKLENYTLAMKRIVSIIDEMSRW